MRTTVETDLYRAFNPSCSLSSNSPLARMMSGSGSDNDLSVAEQLVEDSRLRYQLERELSERDFRVLKLFYTDSADIEQAKMVFQPLRSELISVAKMTSTVNLVFVDLVAISEFWNKNLLKKSDQGVLSDFGNQYTYCRRRKRLKGVLAEWRLEVLGKAKNILNPPHILEVEDKAAMAL